MVIIRHDLAEGIYGHFEIEVRSSVFPITVLNCWLFFILLHLFPKDFCVRMKKGTANECSMEEMKVHLVIEDYLGPLQ